MISSHETNGFEYDKHGFDFDQVEIKHIQPGNYDWRLKSLSGIENNNGWLRIESEADLPEKTAPYDELKYHVLTKEGFEDLSDCNSFELHHMFKKYQIITHYRPVIILPKPLY